MDIRIDPKDFIHEPYTDCPECGACMEFGVLMINDHSYVKRCRQCWHSCSYELPELNKKLIYLDQFVISNMMKSINPNHKAYAKIDSFWLDVFSRLDLLAKKQIIICPDSPTHYDESRVSHEFTQLKRMYQLLSGGVSYKHFSRIEQQHLVRGFINWLDDVNESVVLDREDILSKDPNHWSERFLLTVDFGQLEDEIDALKGLNVKKNSQLEGLFSCWQNIEVFDFEKQYNQEIRSYGPAYIDEHRKNIECVIRSMAGDPCSDDYVFNPSVFDILSLSVDKALQDGGYQEEQKTEKIVKFLQSEYFRYIPYCHISSLMWAGLARKAAAGQKKVPLGSIFNDIRTIANILPYCDAMFIDKECAKLLNEEPLASKIQHDTKIFSLDTKDEFINYLDSMIFEISEDHLLNLNKVYGPEWQKPYLSLYQSIEN